MIDYNHNCKLQAVEDSTSKIAHSVFATQINSGTTITQPQKKNLAKFYVNGDKCNILLVLSKIPSKKHYNFMLKFDNKDELSWCRVASREYKELINKTSLK